MQWESFKLTSLSPSNSQNLASMCPLQRKKRKKRKHTRFWRQRKSFEMNMSEVRGHQFTPTSTNRNLATPSSASAAVASPSLYPSLGSFNTPLFRPRQTPATSAQRRQAAGPPSVGPAAKRRKRVVFETDRFRLESLSPWPAEVVRHLKEATRRFSLCFWLGGCGCVCALKCRTPRSPSPLPACSDLTGNIDSANNLVWVVLESHIYLWDFTEVRTCCCRLLGPADGRSRPSSRR